MKFALVPLLLAIASPAAAGPLAPGDAFPEWQLEDQSGQSVSSASLKGKPYLIWFYPRASTPGCTLEGVGLRDRAADFRARGIEILGVSFDPPADNARFAAEQNFPFRLLSDSGRALAVRVGAADDPAQFAARRLSYLVGPDGRVSRFYPAVEPSAHAGQVLADFDAARGH